MAIKKKNVVKFSEIFFFADEEYDIHWNRANDLFFDTILDYKGSNDYTLEDIEEMMDGQDEDGDYCLACKILTHFMKKNKIKQILVLND